MKQYFILPIVAAGAVSFSSCSKKEEAQTESPEKPVVITEEVIVEVVETVVAEKVSTIDELAAKAGFAKFLPKDTAGFWTFYDGAGLAKKLHSSKLGKFVSTMAEEQGTSIESLLEDPNFQKFAEITGEELFWSIGDGASKQMGNLLKASSMSNFHQMRSLVEVLSKSLEGEDTTSLQSDEYLIDWLKDPKTIELFKASAMPPMYLGFKVSNTEKRQEYVAQLQGFGGMALNLQDAEEEILVSTEKDGFSGFTVKGELVAQVLDSEEGEEMIETIGEVAFKSYKAAVAEKNLVLLAGEQDEYVVIFIGSSTEQLNFAKSADESVLETEGMEFAQQFHDKDLVSLMYMDEEMSKVCVENQSAFKDLALGTIAGLNDSEALGDTRVLEALLGDLIQRESDFYSSYKGGRSGSVAFLEEGFKVESFYEGNAPTTDLKSKRHLSRVSDAEGVVFSANWVCNPAQTKLGLEYIDAIGSTAYQVSKQLSGLEIDDSDLKEFTTGFGMADGMFKQDLLDIWGAIRGDFGDALGAESAIVVDINGELPTVPMIPEALVKQGKIPRISYLSTVKDRTKLASSWESLNSTAESVLKRVGQMTGTPIPMQRPFKSESNGLTNWTFQIPFSHQNCTPCASVSDELFIVGTSSDFANQLADRFDKEATAAPLAEMKLNFDGLRQLGTNWITLIAKDGSDLMGEEGFKSFQEAQPIIEGLIVASDEVDSLSVVYKEIEGEIRSSLHLKTK